MPISSYIEPSSRAIFQPAILDFVLNVDLKTKEGLTLKLGGCKTKIDDKVEQHALIYKGNIQNPAIPLLLRINSACYTSDIFHCSRCDCTWQLMHAMELVNEFGGLIIYHFSHEGRGIGFVDKLKTYMVMDRDGKTTKEAFEAIGEEVDKRDFFANILILEKLGIKAVRLISNNPEKRDFLINNGIEVTEMVPSISENKSLKKYLISKKNQFGHLISFD